MATMFIKATLKAQKNPKTIRNHVLKCNLYLYILIQQKMLICGKKTSDTGSIQGVCYVIYKFFGSALGKVLLCEISSL